MKLRDNQTFLSLYYEPNAVEIATGEADSFASAESWQRVMSAKPTDPEVHARLANALSRAAGKA